MRVLVAHENVRKEGEGEGEMKMKQCLIWARCHLGFEFAVFEGFLRGAA
jgi:hypothetical protein